MTWLVPAALLGLLLAGLPVLVHLTARAKSRRRVFPSLRFLAAASSTRRPRAPEDWLLMAVRTLIVAGGVAALAGPVVETAWRRDAWAARVVRATAVEAGAERATRDEGTTFARERLRDAMADAVRWLQAQPPARRELVVAAEFRVGQFSPADLAGVPSSVGVTLRRIDVPIPPREIEVSGLRLAGDALLATRAAVLIEAEAITVVERASTPLPRWPVRVAAADRDRSLANAALAAVLEAGVRWPIDVGTPIVVAWPGASRTDLERSLGAPAVTIAMGAPRDPGRAASALRDALAAVAPPLDRHEPERISAARLAEWSRPAGPPERTGLPRDEGDRRWFWGAALALLAVEQALRRTPANHAGEESTKEVRVA